MSPGRQSKAAPVAPGGFLPVGLAAVTAYEGCARRRIDDARRDQRRWIDAPLPADGGANGPRLVGHWAHAVPDPWREAVHVARERQKR